MASGVPLPSGTLALPGDSAGFVPGTTTHSVGLVGEVNETITVESPMHEGETWLPMAFAPQGVSFPSAIRYDPNLVTAFAPHAVEAGTRYTVTSEISEPTRQAARGRTARPGVDLDTAGALCLPPHRSAALLGNARPSDRRR